MKIWSEISRYLWPFIGMVSSIMLLIVLLLLWLSVLVSLDDFASLPVATVIAIFAYVFSDQISGLLLLFKILTINAPVWFWDRSLSSVLLCTRFELFKMRMRLPITLTNVPGQYNYSCLNLFITDYWYKFGKWLTHAIIERKRSVVSNTASQQNLALTNILYFDIQISYD